MRTLPRDPLLYARAVALLGIGVFVATGGVVLAPLVAMTVAWVLASMVVLTRASLRKGHPLSLTEVPVFVVVADVMAATSWMIGTGLNPPSVSFVLVIVWGWVALYSLGRNGVLLTVSSYLAARVIQEALRVMAGTPTPVATLAGDSIVVTIAVVILAATVDLHLREQRRARSALERARSLEAISRVVATEGSADEVVTRIAEEAAAAFSVEFVLVAEVDEIGRASCRE